MALAHGAGRGARCCCLGPGGAGLGQETRARRGVGGGSAPRHWPGARDPPRCWVPGWSAKSSGAGGCGGGAGQLAPGADSGGAAAPSASSLAPTCAALRSPRGPRKSLSRCCAGGSLPRAISPPLRAAERGCVFTARRLKGNFRTNKERGSRSPAANDTESSRLLSAALRPAGAAREGRPSGTE